jgi:hypothetical protein
VRSAAAGTCWRAHTSIGAYTLGNMSRVSDVFASPGEQLPKCEEIGAGVCSIRVLKVGGGPRPRIEAKIYLPDHEAIHSVWAALLPHDAGTVRRVVEDRADATHFFDTYHAPWYDQRYTSGSTELPFQCEPKDMKEGDQFILAASVKGDSLPPQPANKMRALVVFSQPFRLLGGNESEFLAKAVCFVRKSSSTVAHPGQKRRRGEADAEWLPHFLQHDAKRPAATAAASLAAAARESGNATASASAQPSSAAVGAGEQPSLAARDPQRDGVGARVAADLVVVEKRRTRSNAPADPVYRAGDRVATVGVRPGLGESYATIERLSSDGVHYYVKWDIPYNWCKVRVEQITRRVSHPAPAPQPPMQEPAAPLMPSVQDQEELRTQLAAKTTEKQQADETLATGVAELASMQAELASMQDLVKEKQRSVREQRRTAKDKAREEQKLSDLVSAGDAAREAKSRQLKDVAEAARASAAAAQTAAEAAEREFAMFATGNSSSQ